MKIKEATYLGIYVAFSFGHLIGHVPNHPLLSEVP